MPDTRESLGVKVALGGLLLLALTATAHTGFLSRTPAALDPDLEQLRLEGQRLERQAGSQPRRDRDHATGTLYRWSALPIGHGTSGFRLETVMLHSRTSSGLGLDAMLDHAGLPAAEHRLQTVEAEARQAGDEVALGQTGHELVLRTCLTPDGRASVSGLKTILHSGRPTGFKSRLLQAMGLQHNIRWECLLVSISIPASSGSEQELTSAWRDVKAPLLAAIQSADP